MGRKSRGRMNMLLNATKARERLMEKVEKTKKRQEKRKQTIKPRKLLTDEVQNTSVQLLQNPVNFHFNQNFTIMPGNYTERKLPTSHFTMQIKEPPKLSGRRLLAIESLNNAIGEMTNHSTWCQSGPIQIMEEKRRGLETELVYSCSCGAKFYVHSDDKTSSLKANEGLVWGCQVSATGYTAASSLLTTLDISPPAYGTYKRHEDVFQKSITDAVIKDMKKWALKEKELAIEANDYVTLRRIVKKDGVEDQTEEIQYPATMVILDGGWSKRSYGHSFSSNCGVAVIIGVRTGKVIYSDVEISTCAVCDRKRMNKIPPHDCCKTWTGPPTGMESAIILKGFQNSIKDYGLVYSSFVGDGDSSVHTKVKNVYPGMEVKKIECKNHVVRNFTTKLMDIATNRVKGADAKISADERRIINPKLHRFRVALRQAIRYNSENGTDFMNLRNDILNIPMHIFGNHSKCRGYYKCNEKDVNELPSVSKMNFWIPLMRAIERAASLAQSLVHDKTSNRAECFMSVASKYTEGKRKNFGQRGLYKIRMGGAVLAYNESAFWASQAYELIKGEAPTTWAKRSKLFEKARQLKAKYRVKRPLKFPLLAERRGDLDYGSNPQRPDMDEETLAMEISVLRKKLQVIAEVAKEIEIATRGQAINPEWFRQRFGRITASLAAMIFKLMNTTSNKSTLDTYFKRKRLIKKVIKAMKYGKDNEKKAIQAYEIFKNLTPGTVKEVGLIVSSENGILAASPDGTIGDDGIVEVKCPYSLLGKSKNGATAHPNQWPDVSTTSCLKRDKQTGKLQLHRSSDHYRQIVMQLHVSKRAWCDYVVWSDAGLYVERIERSAATESLWAKMEKKLIRFWEMDLAPEIVDSRYDRGYKTYRSPSTRQQ